MLKITRYKRVLRKDLGPTLGSRELLGGKHGSRNQLPMASGTALACWRRVGSADCNDCTCDVNHVMREGPTHSTAMCDSDVRTSHCLSRIRAEAGRSLHAQSQVFFVRQTIDLKSEDGLYRVK